MGTAGFKYTNSSWARSFLHLVPSSNVAMRMSLVQGEKVDQVDRMFGMHSIFQSEGSREHHELRTSFKPCLSSCHCELLHMGHRHLQDLTTTW